MEHLRALQSPVDCTVGVELLATCWTTAGDAAPSREDWRSPVSLRERIEAAAAAGFTGFGVLAVDLAVAERKHGLSGIRTMLADNGLVHLELEGLPDWWGAGPGGGGRAGRGGFCVPPPAGPGRRPDGGASARSGRDRTSCGGSC